MSMSFSGARNQPITRSAPAHPILPPLAGDTPPATLHEHLRVLREFGTSLRFARNETVFHEGDPAHHVCRILSGTLRLCRHTPDGRRHIAEFALPGDLCGVFGGSAQAFTAEAITDVTLIAYPRPQFDRLSERDPRFRANILAHLSTHLLNAQLHTFVLGCQSARERLASFILRQAERTGAIDSGLLELSMGRQDIADHLGLTIETICRAISALKAEGVLGVPNAHTLLLKNVEALCELADGSSLH